MTSARLLLRLMVVTLFGSSILCGRSQCRADESAGSWPFIRGDDLDGQTSETGLLDTWPVPGPPVLWTRELGQGYSSFVAWDDRVATQYQTLAGQFVICLDADTGTTLWQHRYDWPHETAGVYPGPRSTPTYANGRLYFASPSGYVGCLDASDGTPRWSRNPKEEFDGDGTDFGYSCSPTVIDGKVLLPVGGKGASMIALDVDDGSLVWQAGDDAASYTPAYPVTWNGRRCVIGYLRNVLICHDLESGELIWRHFLSTGYDEHSAWPIYSEPYLWISSPFQSGSELLEITGDPERPVRTIWKSRRMSNDIFSSVLVDGSIYGFDLYEAQAKVHRPSRGSFLCQDLMTGEELWSVGDPQRRYVERTIDHDAEPRVGHATVIVADGKLILMNDTGELILARVNPKRYEELARVSILGGEICWTQPTIHRKRLFVRSHSRAVCVYLGDPSELEVSIRDRAITAIDLPQRKYVDLAAMILGIEPEYAFDLPSIEWLRTWFIVSVCGILPGSFVVTMIVRGIVGARMGYDICRWMFWLTSFSAGALGTTFISRWQDDFVFTWPVCIFVAFQAAVAETRSRKQQPDGRKVRLRSVAAALLLVVSCLTYFLLCRRLSLVFEWVFLCGFAAALPFSIVASLCNRDRKWRVAWEAFFTLLAFTGFYWGAAAILLFKS
ncbi:MAG: PQQ-binding-like beta-propeller repeat protein [Planctomycetes bacterium]|nr:PQQ-binding-like beta-propeller repeat protein [Planctomycetota bacterium]